MPYFYGLNNDFLLIDSVDCTILPNANPSCITPRLIALNLMGVVLLQGVLERSVCVAHLALLYSFDIFIEDILV